MIFSSNKNPISDYKLFNKLFDSSHLVLLLVKNNNYSLHTSIFLIWLQLYMINIFKMLKHCMLVVWRRQYYFWYLMIGICRFSNVNNIQCMPAVIWRKALWKWIQKSLGWDFNSVTFSYLLDLSETVFLFIKTGTVPPISQGYCEN